MGALCLAGKATQAAERMKLIPVDTVLYWTEDAPDAPDKARAFCQSRGVNSEQVKIVRAMHGDRKMVMVKVRAPCRLRVE